MEKHLEKVQRQRAAAGAGDSAEDSFGSRPEARPSNPKKATKTAFTELKSPEKLAPLPPPHSLSIKIERDDKGNVIDEGHVDEWGMLPNEPESPRRSAPQGKEPGTAATAERKWPTVNAHPLYEITKTRIPELQNKIKGADEQIAKAQKRGLPDDPVASKKKAQWVKELKVQLDNAHKFAP
jgi:hypothetical protein